MKTTTKAAIALLALGMATTVAFAQDGRPQPDGPRPGGPGMGGRRLPPPPVMAVIDANHDGVIDETEIANASKALLTLDKNGDGKLTPAELRPPRPQGVDGQRGARGQRGPNGPGRGPRNPQQDL
jgi:EF hand